MYEFVLRPNSTGYLTLVYDACSNQPDFGRNVSALFSSFDTRLNGIWKFPTDEQSDQYRSGQLSYLSAMNTGGVEIYPSKVTMVNDHIAIVNYTLVAEPQAQTGLYVLSLYHTCPGELLTVGDRPHQSYIPWTDGTFMGCSF